MIDYTTQQLIRDLWYQYPTGCTTMAKCRICESSARGGRYCSYCIVRELTLRVGEEKAHRLGDCIKAAKIAESRVIDASPENQT